MGGQAHHAIAVRHRQKQHTGKRRTPAQFAQQQRNGEKHLAVAREIADRGQPGGGKVWLGQQCGGVHAQQQRRAQADQRKQRPASRKPAGGGAGQPLRQGQ